MANDTSGTPVAPAEDGAAESASGTSAAPPAGGAVVEETPEQLKARIAELESQRKQDLARLSGGEEARRELERLREEWSRANQPPTGHDPGYQQQNELAREWQELVETNPSAARMIAATAQMTQAEIARARQEQQWYRELDAVGASDRAAVEKRAREMRVMPNVAHAFVKAERFEAEQTSLAEQRRKLQEERERLKRGTVDTTASPSPPPPPGTGEITREEFARLSRAALTDPDARRRIADYDAGRLKIRPG